MSKSITQINTVRSELLRLYCSKRLTNQAPELAGEGLASFTRFFLKTCLGQPRFMEQRVQPDRLRNRILLGAEEDVHADDHPKKAERALEVILH